MTLFSLELPVAAWVLLGLALVAAIAAWRIGFAPMRRLRIPEPRVPEEGEALPSLSVIALMNSDVNVEAFLQAMRRQKYPDFEIILVHEGSARQNEVLEERFINPADNTSPHVRFCFYPPGSHSLSRKKLAITIGAKAAVGEWLFTTSARCNVPSDLWLSTIASHFNPHTDVVLGRSQLCFDDLSPRGRASRRFNFLMAEAAWMDAARRNLPFRGDGLNLAYRRSLFFSNKGFAATADLVNGEDDIFINAVATPENTAVEFSDQATPTPRYGEETDRLFDNRRDRRRFTSRFLPRRSFVLAGLTSVCQWLTLLCGIAGALLALPNLVGTIAAVVLFTTIWLFEAFDYRRGARLLGDARGWKIAPALLLGRPIGNRLFAIRRRKHIRANYSSDTLEP